MKAVFQEVRHFLNGLTGREAPESHDFRASLFLPGRKKGAFAHLPESSFSIGLMNSRGSLFLPGRKKGAFAHLPESLFRSV